MLKKVVKYLVLFVSLLIILTIAFLAYTQTASFRELLRIKALEMVNPYFNGELAIGRIDGNLYNTIHLTDVVLTEGDSTVVSIDSLSVNYRIANFKNKNLIIDTLHIQSIRFNLWYKDSATLHLIYVLNHLVKKSSGKPSYFPLILDFRHISIDDGMGSYELSFGSTPISLEEINVNASGYFKDKHVEVKLNSINVQTGNPDFELQEGRLQFVKNGPLINVDSIHLKTATSLLTGKGCFISTNDFKVDIEAKPLDKSDLLTFLPNVPLRTIPHLKLDILAEKNEWNGSILLAKEEKQVGLNGVFYNFPEALKSDDLMSGYKANLFFQQFVPEEWFEINETEVFLNGTLLLDGENALDYKSDLNVAARFNNSSYRTTVVDTLHIDASQINNKIKADVLLAYNNSHSKGHLQVIDLYSKPVYTASFITRNLDIEAIEPSLKKSVINGRVELSGTHIIAKERQLTAKADLNASKVYDVNVDSLVLRSSMIGMQLQLDTLTFKLQDNEVYSSGKMDFNTNDFQTQAIIRSQSLGFLEQFELPDIFYQEANINVNLSGNPDSINYQGNLNLINLEYNTFNCDRINALSEGCYKKDSLLSAGEIIGLHLAGPTQYLDSFSINYNYDDKRLWSLLDLKREGVLTAAFESELDMKDTFELTLKTADLVLPRTHLYLTESNQNIKYHDKSIFVDGFEIRDHENKGFRLKADGNISANNVDDFELDIDSLNLHLLNHFVDFKDSIEGQLSIALKIVGEPDSVALNGDYYLKDLYFNGFLSPSLKGQMNYLSDTLTIDTWAPDLDSSVYVNVNVPIDLTIDSSGYDIEVPDLFSAQLVLDSLEVVTPDIPEYAHIKAGLFLNGLLKVEGEFDKPMIYGEIDLDDGFINNDKQGVYYRDVVGNLVFEGNRINIDTFFIGSDKGYYSSTGHLLFDSTLISGRILSSDMETDINNFHVVQHKDYDVNMTGNPHYRTNENGQPRFGGKVIVNRSTFYIPGLIAGDGTVSDENKPLLVVALEENDSIVVDDEVETKESAPPFIKKLQGRLNIEIPRSTWLKSDDMNIEISGDVDIVKAADYFELFGDVEIVRGHYILYGRKFNIEEGVITFMGGESQDPRLEITAEYIFRGSDKEKHTLQLSITEYLSEPVINFALDEVTITQSDAVSIMVFGKTMDELSYGGQNGIIGSVGSNMLASMVTSSLNSTIGQRFKLDMIEVSSTENWQTAAFVVGKYITNDLFVIYQRGFGETEDDEITPETITLEYELNKVLFFRLQSGSSKTSGFDVILKFESSK